MTRRDLRRPFVVVAALVLAGCAAPATFVSIDPPPDTTGEAWFASPVPAVHGALARSIVEAGLAILDGASSPGRILAVRDQLPHIHSDLPAPAPGRLPRYVVTVDIERRDNQTHVRAIVRVEHLGDPAAPYVWQYPTDLLERSFDGARRILGERARRFAVPPRFRTPRPWRPPPAP